MSDTETLRAARRRWRWVSWAIYVGAGVLVVITALNSHGLDLRAASITDLDHVVRQERARVDHLQRRVAEIDAEVGELVAAVDDIEVSALSREVDALRQPAGFEAVTGPGVTVTLTDAPKHQIVAAGRPGGVQPDQLVVHQQDIQAVVNALWLGGAEAMTIQDQRVISTTAIKCVGNTVVLHGVPYAPPYRITAIGDPALLLAALEESEYLIAYRSFVDAYDLGWAVETLDRVEMAAYSGKATLQYARRGVPVAATS